MLLVFVDIGQKRFSMEKEVLLVLINAIADENMPKSFA